MTKPHCKHLNRSHAAVANIWLLLRILPMASLSEQRCAARPPTTNHTTEARPSHPPLAGGRGSVACSSKRGHMGRMLRIGK